MKSKLNAITIAADVTCENSMIKHTNVNVGSVCLLFLVEDWRWKRVEDNSTVVLTNAENTERFKTSMGSQYGGIIVGYDKEKELLKISQLNSSGDSQGGNFNTTDIPGDPY